MQQLIDISWLPGPQQQTRRMLLQRSIAGTDRQKDTVPLSRPFCVLCGDIPWSQPGAAMPMSPVSPGDRQTDERTDTAAYYANSVYNVTSSRRHRSSPSNNGSIRHCSSAAHLISDSLTPVLILRDTVVGFIFSVVKCS